MAAPGARRARPRMSVGRWILYVVLMIAALVFAFPFYWLVVVGSSTTNELFGATPRLVPGDQFFANLGAVLERTTFARALLNSALLAVLNTGIYLFLAALAGFVFGKFRFPGRDGLFAVLVFTMILPTGVSLVPNFQIYASLGWINTYLPLVVPSAVSAFGIFWMRQVAISSIPDELIQASSVDGANFIRQFFHVGVPGMRAGLTALGIFQLMWNWNEYIWPLLVINDPQLYTVPVALQQLKGIYDDFDYSILMAGTLVATIPLVVVFFFFRRTIMENTSAGAVKG